MIEPTAAKKSLGQHWLKDVATLKAIVQTADIKPGETILEIGPGHGTLTDEILKTKAHVLALEFDADLVSILIKKYKDLPPEELIIQSGDIRTYDLAGLADGYKIVANIPFYLTANLLRILTDSVHKPTLAVLLMQSEVAQRVAAKPGQMSAISVIVQFYYEVSLGLEVPANLFTPPPKVDSQLLILRKRPNPLFSGVETSKFIRLIKVGFAQPRKTLVNNLSAVLELNKTELAQILKQTQLTANVRAQSLSLDDWSKLYKLLDVHL